MIEEKLSLIFTSCFDIPSSEISLESSMETLDVWDSLGHLSLIITIEEEFEISLNEKEVLSMTSFSEIISILKSRNIES